MLINVNWWPNQSELYLTVCILIILCVRTIEALMVTNPLHLG